MSDLPPPPPPGGGFNPPPPPPPPPPPGGGFAPPPRALRLPPATAALAERWVRAPAAGWIQPCRRLRRQAQRWAGDRRADRGHSRNRLFVAILPRPPARAGRRDHGLHIAPANRVKHRAARRCGHGPRGPHSGSRRLPDQRCVGAAVAVLS